MPTPARLVSALVMAALGFYGVVTLAGIVLPEGVTARGFAAIAALCGLVLGWVMLGRSASGPNDRGERFTVVVTAGMMTAVTLAVLLAVGQAFRAMILKSLTTAYREPWLAMEAWMDFIVTNMMMLSDPRMLLTIFVGGALCGVVAWGAGRGWT